MKRILAMLRVSVIQVLRDRGELVSMLVLPVLLTYVFGVAFGAGGADRPILVLWLEGDTSVYADQVRELVDAEDSIEVETATRAEADQAVEDGEVSLIVRTPDGFGDALESGEAATVEVEQVPGSQRGQAALEAVQGAVARVNANAQAAWFTAGLGPYELDLFDFYPVIAGLPISFAEAYEIADSLWEPSAPIGVQGATVTESEVRSDSVLAGSNIQYSAGFMIMFVMFMAFNSAGGILEEREQGTLRRLLVTPVRRPVILGGKIAGVIGTSSLEAVILIGLGALAFSVPWGNDPLALVLLVGAYILAASGLAVFITAIVRTRGQLSAAGPVAATALAMLGGCYWPIEVTPPFMQTVAKLTPTGWAMSGLLDVVARNQGLDAAWLPLGILLGMAALFFGGGLIFLRFE